MTDKHIKDILEPLQHALKLEREGKKFFSDAARRCQRALPRRTFEFLAEEEDRHIEHIERFYHSLVDSADAAPPILDEQATADRFNNLIDRLGQLRADIDPSLSDLEAYQTAIKFENGAEDFYREQIGRTDKPHIKSFYEWLIREEERHASFLHDCVAFAKDPSRWFSEHDSPDSD